MTRTATARRIFALLAVAALFAAGCESKTARSTKGQTGTGGPVEAPPKVSMVDSPVKGPATAPVTIVEVSDFQ